MRKSWRRLLHLIAPAGIFLGWKQLAADKKRLFTAIAGVTFGTMLMLFQLGLYNAINTMVVLPHFNLEGELVMTSPDFEYFGSSRQFTRRRLVQAASLPEVRAAAPVYIGFVYWRNPQTGTTKTMFAMARPSTPSKKPRWTTYVLKNVQAGLTASCVQPTGVFCATNCSAASVV